MLKSKKAKRAAVLFIAALVAIGGVFYFYTKSKAAKPVNVHQVDPAFSAYISSYTAGVISSGSSIKVALAHDIADSTQIGKALSPGLFAFSPSITGSAFWIDARTIEFRPKERLAQGKEYKAVFHLSQLMETPEGLKEFPFVFQTVEQNFDIQVTNLSTYETTDLTRQKLDGLFITADYASAPEVEAALKAFQDGQAMQLNWQHQPDGKSHVFTVENVARKEKASSVELKWSGSPLKISKTGEMNVEVAALGDFKITNTKVIQSPDQYLLLQFSDPLMENQDLNGLISIGELSDLRFFIHKNEITVYPPVRQAGSKEIYISPGIKNALGYGLQKEIRTDVVFEQIKPAVRLVGNGVILPSSEGLVFPFEAVNLKAVEIRIVKIFENNVLQFLQVNDLDGDRELARVGRPLVSKVVPLNGSGITDLNKWNRYAIDLSEFLRTEPGAVYQVKIGFKKRHSVFYCEGQENQAQDNMVEMEPQNLWDEAESDFSPWDNYEDYYYDPDYDWNERDNPCHSSYYGERRSVNRNVLASDLGIIVKRGGNGQLLAIVTDLKTTSPFPNVKVDIYNFQRQIVGSGITDTEGKVVIDVAVKPFLLVASQNEQRGYLKLDDGSSLPVSAFNVQGQVIQQGVKGFIYGERGVWRPGDTLHLTFMLEDRDNLVPESHPVIFELFNPRGQVEKRIVQNTGVGGMYNFSVKTDDDAATGDWIGKVSVGGATFSKSLKIETIKPNRLKIRLDFGADKLTAMKPEIIGNLEVKWLHGAVARNLKADFEAILTPGVTRFEDYPDYIFDDPARDFESESKTIFDGSLDEDGKAVIRTSLVAQNAPGVLMANIKGKVFEEGGDFSIDRFTIPYYPYSSFVGVRLPQGDKARGMLLTDTLHTVSLATVDANGNPVSRNRIDMEIYKLDWRWWWDNSQASVANYVSSRYHSPVKSGKVKTVNGRGTWNFKINYPEWGRYLVRACDPESGHCTGKIIYIDWPGWAGRARRDIPGGASILSFSAEKENYRVGEEIRINIPSGGAGRALVSVENGSKVLLTRWIETQKGETPVSFTATKEMSPNIYINVSLLQPHSQTVNDLPIRLYGIVPVKVEDTETIIKPLIAMADVLKPDMKVDIRISEANGHPMAYTIAVVDDGLLDLTRFKTPDPWSVFYAKEALGVKTWDLYDEVMGAFGGKLESLLAIGGDGEIEAPEDSKANRFKPVVTYLGPFMLEKGRTATHSFRMPQYVGSVRAMVVAGYEGAYGFAEKTMPVKQELMILATLPRVLGPEESVNLPVNIFSGDASIRDVRVEAKVNDLFTIEGAAARSVSFTGEGDQLTEFKLKIKPALGVGKMQAIATSGNFTAQQAIEIEVRNPNPPVTDVKESIIEPGKKYEFNYTPIGMAGTNSGIIEVSSIPPINLGRRLKFLMNYPHGCVEQTTSAVFPQLYVSNIKELVEGEALMIEQNVKAGIDRMRKFQTTDGGFAYWPGDRDADPWGSAYGGHFLLEAEAKGYHVPATLISGWVKYQRQQANKWRPNSRYNRDDLVQAYRLYTLALAKKPELGAMNRMREIKDLSVQARWRLAAAYTLAGQADAAKEIISNLNFSIAEYRELSYTYGTPLRDKAMILETLSLLNDRVRGIDLVKEISAALSDNDMWLGTQTTAYCLIAISKFVGRAEKSEPLGFAYQLNNGKVINARTELPMSHVQLEIKSAQPGKASVENKTSAVMFARLILEGVPASGDTSSVENSLMMDIVYKDMKGKIIDPGQLPQGLDFVAEVTLANPGIRGNYEEMALTQIFPSGWEIHNVRMDETGEFYQVDKPDYQDIRDDRVYTYFDLRANQRKTFRILLNASYAGEYYLPTIYCEAMYDRSINARKAGRWVKVVKEENSKGTQALAE